MTAVSKNILVCGGAGYIGSHMARLLSETGHNVAVLDNLCTGHRAAVEWSEFIQADLRDPEALRRIFREGRFDAVFDFAAHIEVGESMTDPAKYYENNVLGTFRLLEAMREAGVDRFVFSSTAAVYGNPLTEKINEDHPQNPINPYGASKLMVERILTDFAQAYGLRSVSFRYFNAAGAHPDARIGEAHHPETHLIPNVLAGLPGQGPKPRIFGDRYPTRDGTCVRDYIHVQDLCQAHLAALAYMDGRKGAHSMNLGAEKGVTVKEIIAAAEEVTGRRIDYEIAPPRAGDPAVLVADSTRARKELGWTPKFEDIRQIIETAWQWHLNRRY